MKYNSFTIQNYRGISTPITIVLHKHSIIPIIGINEAGKTTILEAIFCFDNHNDDLNGGKHLDSITNLYVTNKDYDTIISAEVVATNTDEIIDVLEDTIEDIGYNVSEDSSSETDPDTPSEEIGSDSISSDNIYLIRQLIDIIRSNDIRIFTIQRVLNKKNYTCTLFNQDFPSKLGNLICENIIQNLPYILYFDDFREAIDSSININPNEGENKSPWLPYIDQIFKTANPKYSINKLPSENTNIRSAIVREAQRVLRKALIENWERFNIDESVGKNAEKRPPLDIELEYHNDNKLEFKIVEKLETPHGPIERFFSIKDRSKGFFWYFNFIMKLEFNPKKRDLEDVDTIYLLDEPGSYLHSSAQNKLCGLLKGLSEKNKVIFCTHSPYLLDPEHIPINSIMLSEKNADGKFSIKNISESKLKRNNSAFQPIIDALQIKPITLLYEKDNVVLTEGISDYYVYETFKGEKKLNFFPSDSALSIINHISYMIFLGKQYTVIWDNDKNGEDAYKKAVKTFGEAESQKWILLPKSDDKKKSKLESLFSPEDIESLKKILGLDVKTSFEKVCVSIFYSKNKDELIKNLSPETNEKLSNIYELILAKM